MVVLAAEHNPSIITKDWLLLHGVATGEIADFVNTPVISVVNFKSGLTIQVEKERLLIAQNGVFLTPSASEVSRVTNSYVSLLSHTRYVSHGVNFRGNLIGFSDKSDTDAVTFIKDRFLLPGSLSFSDIDPKDVSVALKIGYPHEGGLCNFTIDPDSNKGKILISFNYHVPKEGSEAITKTASQIDKIWEIFRHGIGLFDERCAN
jgi:hypothetical protein